MLRAPALLTVLLLGLAASPAQAQRAGEVIDGIVAVVGTHPILRSDVDALAFALGQGRAPTPTVRRAALDELITQRVLATHAARDTTIRIAEDEVNQALDERTQDLIRRVGSQQAVEELYGRSVSQLREDYRAEVRRQLEARQLQQRRYFNVRITPQEVRQWYHAIPADSLPEVPELVRVAHIVRFPALEAGAREEARAQIEALRDSILTGASTIEALARRHSQDPGSREAGGRYAAINLRDLVPEFGAVAGTLSEGQLSQVFETPFGFHVMRLNSRRGDVIDFNHILIALDDSRTDPTEAIRTLTMLRDSVVTGGASFARLAREYSEDASSAARGGNVTVPQTGDRDLRFEALGPHWQATLDALEAGEISEPTPVQLLDGRQAYHIALLQRRTPAHTLSLELDYPLIEEFALQEKRQRELERWARDLRAQVYIACKDERYCPADLASAGR